MLIKEVLTVIVSVFLFALPLSMNTALAYASTSTPPTTASADGQPKPGTLIVITFENGTTKVVRSTSTNVLPVTGGYLVVDPSVVPSQLLPAKIISKSVVNQFNTAIAIVYSVIFPSLPPTPPPITQPPPSPTNCPVGTKLNPANGECEPMECDEGEILQGNQCVPGFAPCGPEWSNPCPGQQLEPTPQPVAPQPQPVEPEPEPEPEADPTEGNQGGEENQNGNSDGGDSNGSTEEEGDNSDEEESEE